MKTSYVKINSARKHTGRRNFEDWKSREIETLKQSIDQQYKAALEQWKLEVEEEIRQDATKRSKSVMLGQITEHLVPFLPDFKYNPKDARFLGTPVDLIVFDGLSDGQLKQVVFIEVKSGSSKQLTQREKTSSRHHLGQARLLGTILSTVHRVTHTRNQITFDIDIFSDTDNDAGENPRNYDLFIPRYFARQSKMAPILFYRISVYFALCLTFNTELYPLNF